MVRDYDGTVVQGATVVLEAYYPTTNTLSPVYSSLTNNIGVASAPAEILQTQYEFQVQYGGVVRYQSVVPETLMLTSNGYWSKQINLQPLATQNRSQNYGFLYNFSPSTVLTVNKSYTFTANLSSAYWVVTSYSWTLLDDYGNVLGTTAAGCVYACSASLTYTPNASGAYQGILSVSTSGFTNTYEVMWTAQGFTVENYTLATAMNDVSNFNAGGFSGWSRFFLSLLVIAMCVLGVTRVTDLLAEPESIIVFVFALTLLFSYVNWLYLDIPGMPLAGLKQYFLAIITGLIAGIAILKKAGVVTIG